MGSINKKSSIPVVQPTIALPPPPAAISLSTSEESSSEEIASEQRRENLLRRSRGRLGTIVSSFRGLLNPDQENNRKTLLGE